MAVILQPISPGLIRIERSSEQENTADVLHVAAGQHSGIIVKKQLDPGSVVSSGKSDVSLEFTVFLVNASGGHSQERRKLKFWFTSDGQETRFHEAQAFFKHVLQSDDFPRDYSGFIKRLLKLIQSGYPTLRKLEVEMKPVSEPAPQPPTKQAYESSIWDRALQGQAPDEHIVQEVLEHAYPSALSVDLISKNLHANPEEILTLLRALEKAGIATQQGSAQHWVRTASTLEHRVNAQTKGTRGPTVAIITALFVEKLAVDSMISNRQTYVRYKTDGESNVYTLGDIGPHRVVATKLSAVGHTREAMIAAGSITTRLLGGYPTLEHVIVVGVGGGVPHYADATRHVRLGDVVVSTPNPNAYLYCDHVERNRVTEAIEGYAIKSWRQAEDHVVSACKQLSEENKCPDRPVWQECAQQALGEMGKTDFHFERPTEESDKLYMFVGGEDVVEVSHPDARTYSKLHFGPIVRNFAMRSEFASQFGLVAFDQEFDSVVESIFGNRINSWALIRGVADYVDGTRNKLWQPYAALQAAAFAKKLIMLLPLSQEG